jgi:hydrogenase-4 component B
MSSSLIALLLVTPVVCGLLDAMAKKRLFSIVGSALSLLALAALWLHGENSTISVPILLPGMGVSFGTPPLGMLLASVTLVVWLAASIFSLRYMQHEHNQARFYLLFGLSVAGTLACFLAQDFLAFLLGFEVMSLTSYGLVAHSNNEKAKAAGRLYLYLGVLGGVMVAVALALLWQRSGSLSYAELHDIPLLISVMLSIGFGIKAGAYPMHFWLPEAHPVAPSPGSALLSGILIKTGAFGLLQVATLTAAGHTFGVALIIVALITMSWGVLLALVQHDAKRMLAYHSVSQMGYILLGIGLWALDRNALGLGGAVFHIVNHALFKSALFLICGSALLSAGTVDLYGLGRMRKAFGWLTPLAMIPALGIAGVPGFNGYISKTLLHDALLHVEAPSLLLVLAEKVFVLVAFGTVCSFIKFSWYVFFADRKGQGQLPRTSTPEVVGIGVLATFITALGIFPRPVLNVLSQVAHGLHAHWPQHLELYGHHALQSSGTVLLGGLVLFFVGLYSGLFHLHLPERLSTLAIGARVGNAAGSAFIWCTGLLNRAATALSRWEFKELNAVKRSLQALDYAPSSSPGWRTLSVTNLNFDVYVVMAVLSVLIIMYPLIL